MRTLWPTLVLLCAVGCIRDPGLAPDDPGAPPADAQGQPPPPTPHADAGRSSDASPEKDAGPAGTSRLALADVRYWAYQIQDLDVSGAVQKLADSRYDMIVVEPMRTDWSPDTPARASFDTAAMVRAIGGSKAHDGVHRKIVLAYLDIGEAEDWRWYWTWGPRMAQRDCDPPACSGWPSFVVQKDPDGWEGNYPVAYWDPGWKDIVLYGKNSPPTKDRPYVSIFDEVLMDGFDGVYLDWVEAAVNDAATQVVAKAAADGVDRSDAMIAFIKEMRAYAAARGRKDFLIVQQNAADLPDGHPDAFDAVDAIAQEAIWYDGPSTTDWSDTSGYGPIDAADTTFYLSHLAEYRKRKIPVFNVDYTVDACADFYAKSKAQSFVPFCSRRQLSELATTTPPGY